MIKAIVSIDTVDTVLRTHDSLRGPQNVLNFNFLIKRKNVTVIYNNPMGANVSIECNF